MSDVSNIAGGGQRDHLFGLAEGFGLAGLSQGMFEGGQAGRSVYETLRRQIVRLDLPPGTALPRAELARAFGVSVTPLRDALQKLAEEGLVLIYPQSRTLVAPLNLAAIREAQFLRLALETEVVRQLATDGIPPGELERLRGIQKLQASIAADPGQMATFQELDEVFHQSLFASGGHAHSARLMRSHSGHLDRLRRIVVPGASVPDGSGRRREDEVIVEHAAIIEAIANRDPDLAAGSMRRHLGRTIDRLAEKSAAFPEYFA